MSRDVRELLEQAAPEPTRGLDAERLVDQAVRQRRGGLTAAAVLILVIAAGVVGLVAGLLPGDEPLFIDPAVPDPQPATVSPYLDGTSEPDLPAGEPGQVSVVAAVVYWQTAQALYADEPPVDWEQTPHIAYVVRNRTDTPVAHLQLRGDVRGADGETIVEAVSVGYHHPEVVRPGEIAIGFLELVNIPADELDQVHALIDNDVTVEVTVTGYETDVADLDERLDQAQQQRIPGIGFSMVIVDTEHADDTIHVRVRNETSVEANMPFNTYAVCFDGPDLVGGAQTMPGTVDEPIPPGQETVLTIDVSHLPCPSFIVGSVGAHSLTPARGLGR